VESGFVSVIASRSRWSCLVHQHGAEDLCVARLGREPGRLHEREKVVWPQGLQALHQLKGLPIGRRPALLLGPEVLAHLEGRDARAEGRHCCLVASVPGAGTGGQIFGVTAFTAPTRGGNVAGTEGFVSECVISF
jgi:hypothetical protein